MLRGFLMVPAETGSPQDCHGSQWLQESVGTGPAWWARILTAFSLPQSLPICSH